MAHVVGRLENVGIGLESTRGTAVAADYWLPRLDVDFDDKANVILDDSGLGIVAEHSNATIQKQWADGSLGGYVYQNSVGTLLTLLSGQAPSSSVSSGEYTHVFTQAQNVTNKSGTIALKDGNLDIRYANAVLDSITFNLETERYFNFEAQFMSKKSATATNTVSRSAENLFAPKHAVVKVASAQSGLGAAGAVSIRSASITFAKNVEDKQVLGSTDISDVYNRQVTVTGSLEVYYTDSTYKDYVFNETERALRIGVENTDVELANTSNPHIYFDLYRVRFRDWERQRGNNDIVMETVEFTALTDFSSSLAVYRIELLNGIAGTVYGGS